MVLNFSTLIFQFITEVISSVGYPGIFVLMALESKVAPVPSDLVVPFAGFLVASGKLDIWLVILVSSLGSLTGSLLSYFIAYFGEKELIHRFGKFVLLDKKHLEKTEEWFKKKGGITILISRFIPVIRHLISLSAGLARMDLKKFILYTLTGATIWNTFLLWVGIQLKDNWKEIHKYSSQLDVLVIVGIVIVAAYYLHPHIKKHWRL